MSQSLPPLALALLVLCIPIWVVTEAVAAALAEAGKKATWWAQLLLRLLPVALGMCICAIPGALATVMGWVGYEPKQPPDAGAAAFVGLFAGAAAVLLHQWGLQRALAAVVRKVAGRAAGGGA